MPASKHRKKGQAKAVKRPGKARVVSVPAWQRQHDRVMDQVLAAIRSDELEDDEFEMVSILLDIVLEETMALGVAGDRLVPRIGSRTEAIDAFAAEMVELEGEGPGGEEPGEEAAFRRLAVQAMEMFEARGVVRFVEDQMILELAIPQLGAAAR